jgi:periplasmic divalent cation tolerance protein
MTDKIVVFTTADAPELAEKLARQLVEKRLAACVNLVPGLRSIYRWQGAVEDASEILLIIKSSRGLFPQLRAEIERLHTYEVPELIALSIVDGSASYLDWLDGQLRSQPATKESE